MNDLSKIYYKKGITLLEVLIALAIISFSLLSAYRAVNLTAVNYDKVQDNILSSIIARNILTDITLSQSINRLDKYICQESMPYTCKINTKKTPNKYLYAVEIIVYKNDKVINTLSSILPHNID